jgi:flavin reductase (DIM6/NTAB) family NADH-FMN oxidoreductase RutF
MATWALREAVNLSAMALPPEVDEFERAGVTKAHCVDAPGPRVAESPCHFECRFHSTHRLVGRSAVGTIEVVYGEVVRIHVADDALTSEGKIDVARLRPLARLGYYDYTSVTETFEMRIPGASDAAADGLEGRA